MRNKYGKYCVDLSNYTIAQAIAGITITDKDVLDFIQNYDKTKEVIVKIEEHVCLPLDCFETDEYLECVYSIWNIDSDSFVSYYLRYTKETKILKFEGV